MKATIDEKGLLMISPETPLEAFALKCWADTAFTAGSVAGKYIVVVTEVPKEQHECRS